MPYMQLVVYNNIVCGIAIPCGIAARTRKKRKDFPVVNFSPDTATQGGCANGYTVVKSC